MSKIKIEDMISNTLKGDSLKNALNLIIWANENKLNPAQSSVTTWKINSKACVVCHFRFDFDAGTLHITPFLCEYEHDSLSDELKGIALANKKRGMPCGERCHACSYKLKTIFGKKDDACAKSITFNNPNAEEIECIKALIKMRKNVLLNGVLMSTLPRNFG